LSSLIGKEAQQEFLERGNREISEISEPQSALGEGSGFFAYFTNFAVPSPFYIRVYLCGAIYENSAFSTKFFPLCFLFLDKERGPVEKRPAGRASSARSAVECGSSALAAEQVHLRNWKNFVSHPLGGNIKSRR
jgi:hypothetical protein